MTKLILFDIDETILHSDGVGRRAMQAALSSVFQTDIDASGHNMSGKTDPQICFELLRRLGYQDELIERNLPKVFEEYLLVLSKEIEHAKSYRLHPGIAELISFLHNHNSCRLALLTGNIESGARIKLEPFDLNKYFPTGAFGSDHADRLKLPEIAHQRATESFAGVDIAREEIVVIGDATNDILCAKSYGVRSLVTCTGRTPKEELEALKPDYIFNDLSNLQQVCQAIFA